MTAATTKLEINDALCVALMDGGERMAIQLDRDRALEIGATLIEFAMRRPGAFLLTGTDTRTNLQHGNEPR